MPDLGPSPTPKTRDAARTRASILAAAREVFAESGFSGARTNEIAKRAGVPQGLLYHYFANKEALFREVLDDALAPYFQATTNMLEQAGGPTPGLLAGTIRLYFDFLGENPHVVRLMTWWQANEGWRRGLPIASGDICHKPSDIGIRRIQQGQAAGLIRPEIDPHTLIDMFIALCMHWHSSNGWSCTERGIDPADAEAVAALNDRYREHAIELVMRGALTPEGYAAYAAEKAVSATDAPTSHPED